METSNKNLSGLTSNFETSKECDRVLNRDPGQLVVALDFPKAEQAIRLSEELSGLPVIYKVGLELFLSGGLDLVRELVRSKKRVFLDLKFHDIPNTVAKAVKQAALLQVDWVTTHLVGGKAMYQAIAKELEEIPNLRPKVLGVSVLTSFDDLNWAEVTRSVSGHAAEPSRSVEGLLESASSLSWGVDGIVCSAKELPMIRKLYPGFFTVVPGIRPEGSQTHDQARVATPKQAYEWGAHAIVVGRPITQNETPRKVAESILKDLCQYY